nr:ATP-dependent DNA helicase RecQ [Clostridia bacterium]
MESKRAILKQVFGYDQFRGGQEALVDAICSGRDVLGVMPTGAGKSLCFQIPALLFPGITLVVSPLISLMKDQVSALCQAGVAAAYLNSSLTPGQYAKALANAYRGQYKIIYVAPERLLADDLLDFARQSPISLLAVDEAHCVSQWGHDFRPSYLDIPRFLERLEQRRPPVAAFTATATPRVQDDIQTLLALRDPFRLVTGFDRPNLLFEVQSVKVQDKNSTLQGLVSEQSGKSGIVYCSTRAQVESVCSLLCSLGHPATRYHAGLPDAERKANQEAFTRDEKPVIVATNAFGMGIDKSNVSFVIHYNMPKDVESYYQEAGRAGRDGMPARCTLLYNYQDVITQRYLIQNGGETEERDPAAVRNALDRLELMASYCAQRLCLRAYLLRYFGEQAPDACGACS